MHVEVRFSVRRYVFVNIFAAESVCLTTSISIKGFQWQKTFRDVW